MRRFHLLSFSFTFYLLSFILILSCSSSTDAPPSDEGTVRERVEVSGLITEDAVWESGKDYVVTGDVTVEAEATLTIEPSRCLLVFLYNMEAMTQLRGGVIDE